MQSWSWAAYYAVHVGAVQVVAREGAAVSEQGYLMARPPSLAICPQRLVQLRWRCLRYKRPWWSRPKRLVDVWVLSYWRLKFYVLYSFGVILALVDIRLLMAKYTTLATCNCGQSGGAKEFVSCIQAHVYSCLGAHVTLLPSKILQVGRSPSFLWKAWEAIVPTSMMRC